MNNTHLSLLLSTLFGAALAACAASAGEASPITEIGASDGGDGEDPVEDGPDGSKLPKDGGAKVKDAQTNSAPVADAGPPPVLPAGGPGFSIAIDQEQIYDKNAVAHRDRLIGPSGTTTFNGITVFYMDSTLLTSSQIRLKVKVKGGGNGYLATGNYACATDNNKGSNGMALDDVYVSLVNSSKSNASYQSMAAGCVLTVTSSGPITPGGKFQIVGKITGKLTETNTNKAFPVTSEFDLVYDN